ncbi:FAD/NAD(P)-binding protein [Sphingomonas baiyangensis]|uniref:FAD-dependent oxidoreductase n=1 Tax=Sphingomonas baiyangensis TaxID=2572576 RepID=A0A4U1L5S5_9SPHN|nr:FAD/NAD(P)-binding protein [Sphingomonas baiyangensis]TKD51620.1 FAD-dependent oxidoreductase [Sphingomonas baiyangensis]
MHRNASLPAEHLLIVGAGFSGTLLAINLLRHGGPRVTLVERRRAQVARGVAYSAADDSHLLNVRAGNMSAFPDDRDHFVRWLALHDLGDARSFVRRTTYGRYLRELLETARRSAGDRLTLVDGEVVALEYAAGTIEARLADGSAAVFDRAVLALGNLPPHAPPGIDVDALPDDLYCDDPWSADIAERLTADDEVLLLGTGLTAIDAALLLERRGFAGRITAMSRRGLRPRAHDDAQPPIDPLSEKPARRLSRLVAAVRARTEASGWRGAVDALRPVTQLMWSGADIATRQRFLRHLRPYWDVHRHRLAPSIAQRLDALVAERRLAFVAGKLVSASPEGRSLRVAYRPRGGNALVERTYRRVVNCTGPQGDLLRSREPLLGQLLASGLIRPDALRLGIDVDAATHVITRDGEPHPTIHAIGPMTRGAHWEVVAVPDIRVQCWSLARLLANAHWVGGEGL